MVFADKLIQLRKKAGWSQEELAAQLDVTRQSVSKWEGEQSIPDIDKIIRISELFGVSIDYLLKDEIDEVEPVTSVQKTPIEEPSIRRVSMDEAQAFISVKADTSKPIAFGVFLCIISPICLLVLGAISSTPKFSLAENVASAVGLIVLFILVTIAVAIFILNGSKTAPFEYLEKDKFEMDKSVIAMVQELKGKYKNTYIRDIIIGVCLCIMSLVPFFVGMMIDEDNELLLIIMLSLSFVIVGIGVVLFVRSGIIWASYQKLLQEEDYSKENKEKQGLISEISWIYFLITTAIFIAYSFITNNWGYSWIIFAVAGVMYPVVIGIINMFGYIKQR